MGSSLRVERIEPHGDVGAKGIEHPKLMHATGSSNLRQQSVQELLVSFAVKDDDGHMAAVDGSMNVLGGNIVQQGGLARARLSDYYGLHPPGLIRPIPTHTM